MQKVIECVPNFSEGQRKEVILYYSTKEMIQSFFFVYLKVIDTIAHAIAGVEGVALLDIDPGLSTNRTIYSKIMIIISLKVLFFSFNSFCRTSTSRN